MSLATTMNQPRTVGPAADPRRPAVSKPARRAAGVSPVRTLAVLVMTVVLQVCGAGREQSASEAAAAPMTPMTALFLRV
jgi:hypothetical protein